MKNSSGQKKANKSRFGEIAKYMLFKIMLPEQWNPKISLPLIYQQHETGNTR